MLRYTLLRLALFLVVLVVLSVPPIEAGPLLAVVLAAVISALLSYVLLARQRNEVAKVVEERAARRLKPPTGSSDEEIEDAAVDRGRAARPAGTTVTTADATGADGSGDDDPLRLGDLRPEPGDTAPGRDQSARPNPSNKP